MNFSLDWLLKSENNFSLQKNFDPKKLKSAEANSNLAQKSIFFNESIRVCVEINH